MRRHVLGALLLFRLLAGPETAFGAEATLLTFSPEGTVKNVRQVAAQFSDSIVAFGDLRASEPFDVTCPEPGTGRWVDDRSWVYDFDRDLPAGIQCSFRLKPDIKTLDGRLLAGRREFAFSTGGPTIVRSNPWDGSDAIDEEQAFILSLDAEATEASVLEHVYFSVEGISERVGVRPLTGPAREQLIKTWVRDPQPAAVVVLQARQRFPEGSSVRLIWGPGVAARSGVATEQAQTLTFKVRPSFTVTVECERENPTADCIPITPLTISFSAPVATELARQVTVMDPAGHRYPVAPREGRGSPTGALEVAGPFPETSALTVTLPPALRDDSGRAPANAAEFPRRIATDAYPSLAKFAARFGILEARADPALPVTLRNLEPAVATTLLRIGQAPGAVKGRIGRVPHEVGDIVFWLGKLASARRDRSVFGGVTGRSAPATRRVQLPKPNGPSAFEVVGIPLGEPGLYLVELESVRLGSQLLGEPKPMYVAAGALVTNLAVHLKLGRASSLIWVTTLDQARPVAQAAVSIHDCKGTTVWVGATDASGLAFVPSTLPERLPACPDEADAGVYQQDGLAGIRSGLWVVARTADDLSFAHSTWTEGIEAWRFQLPPSFEQGDLTAHTVLDRSLFRAGDTVHMNHVLRRRTLRGLGDVAASRRPATVVIRHEGSNDRYELPLQWGSLGIAESRWSIPRTAKLGRYAISLVRPAHGNAGGESIRSGEFRVEEFSVPLMRATLRPPSDPLIGTAEFPLDLAVQYLAGGGAGRLPVTVRAQLRPKALPPIDGFEQWSFGRGPVAPGIRRSGADGPDGDDGASGGVDPRRPAVHQRESLELDPTGTARVMITRLPAIERPMDVLTELEYRDPTGQVQTAATRVPLWAAAYLPGIDIEVEASPDGRPELSVQVAVVDLAGKPVADAPLRVRVFKEDLYSNRKRLVGGFYAYEHVAETTAVGELCAGKTNGQGVLRCAAPVETSGHLIVEASTTDPAGRGSATHTDVWVPGEDAWFDVQDSDRIDLIPARRRYEPGETARLQVRMPFRQATALVTTERDGVIDARVLSLTGTDPTVDVPISSGYAPNVFVSVLAVRGRVADPRPTAMVDLGRPAFKLGIAELRVGWRAHELQVRVTSPRSTYRVRDRARVRVRVKTPGGNAPPAGAEVAIAAVDEGLLELSPNPSWDLLEAMMARRGYGVTTATAQGYVVGRRHFGLKALPHGGGGGAAVTRELFDTLLLWKGRVTLDPKGEATLEIPLNDSLTAFKIVAVATSPGSRFGTGTTVIRSTQDLMILPGLAPLVREGDRFTAEVTLRNTTGRSMALDVAARVDGSTVALLARTLRLLAGEAKAVGWDLTAPSGVQSLSYVFEVREGGRVVDRVKVSQAVSRVDPVRTVQATMLQLEEPTRVTVEQPAGAVPGRGSVRVVLTASLAEGLSGVRDWFATYPYTCLEQLVSRAVALRDVEAWRSVLALLPSYLDADGLLMFFPTSIRGDPVLTAYVLAIAQESGGTLPAELRDRLTGALRGFVEGTLVRTSLPAAADLPLRKLTAIEALSRYGKADAALLGSLTIEPTRWPTSTLLDWWGILERVSTVPDRTARLAEVEQLVRARLTLQGTTMGFSTEQSDRLWWLLVSPDANAARLILILLPQSRWTSELPRIVRGALGRQRRGVWDLTTANAWGTVAIAKFSRTFEKTPVSGATLVMLDAAKRSLDWQRRPTGGTLSVPWPSGPSALELTHTGSGRPWATIESQAAIPLAAPLSAGYRLTRTLIPVEASHDGRWSRGDIARVRLVIEAQADMSWVVVNDPVPGGASHLGTGLARDSQILAASAAREDASAWPVFEERAFDAYRAYYAWLPKGTHTVEYTIRLNQSGRFQLPPSRVEALYAPEAFGEIPNAPLVVEP